MNNVQLALITLLTWVIFPSAVVAGDVEDVIAAELDLLDAENAGDVERLYRHIDSGRSVFLPGGGFLFVAGGEQDAERRQASFDQGVKLDLRVRHLEVEIYGDTALLTYYRVGTITRSDGTSRRVTLRVSTLRVKKEGRWLEVHRHGSNMAVR